MSKTIGISTIIVLILINLAVFSCNNQAEQQSDTAANTQVRTAPAAANAAHNSANNDAVAQPATDTTALEQGETALAEAEANAAKMEAELAARAEEERLAAEKKAAAKKAAAEKAAAEKKRKAEAARKRKAAERAAELAKGKMTFDKKVHDFGVIDIGDKVSHKFTFTNTGKSPLIIKDASSTCGCTIPSYPQSPIAPGASASIDVVFDSTGKIASQNKEVTILHNGQGGGVSKIALKGVVITPNLRNKDADEPSPSTAANKPG